jgi:broad specificity phosphatase PhoE
MILLIRHGQTLFNAEGRLQGQLDSPLSEAGRRHARSQGVLIGSLIHGEADKYTVVSSPLGRAKATAEIICRTAQLHSLHFDDRLAEVSFGSWDGLTPAEIDAGWPGLRQSSLRVSWASGCPGAESYDEAAERAADWLEAYRDRPVVAVTHGVMGSLIRGLYANLSKNELLRLPVPHDTVFALKAGRVEPIACP